jgi:quinol monooxygenase YgiN
MLSSVHLVYTHGDLFFGMILGHLEETHMTFAIVATFDFKTSEDRDKMIPPLKAHRDRCLAGESGTIQFDLALPNDNDKKIMLYEVYADEDAFNAHWNGESIKTIRAEQEALGIKSELSGVRCTVVD